MGRKVLFCFDPERDLARAKEIRATCDAAGHEALGFFGSDPRKSRSAKENRAIKTKITELVKGTAVTIVLIGRDTARHDWLDRELATSAKAGHGLLAIHIWQMKNEEGQTDTRGKNPLDRVRLTVDGKIAVRWRRGRTQRRRSGWGTTLECRGSERRLVWRHDHQTHARSQ